MLSIHSKTNIWLSKYRGKKLKSKMFFITGQIESGFSLNNRLILADNLASWHLALNCHRFLEVQLKKAIALSKKCFSKIKRVFYSMESMLNANKFYAH